MPTSANFTISLSQSTSGTTDNGPTMFACDPDNTYGLRRVDTKEILISPTQLTKIDYGRWSFEFTLPDSSILPVLVEWYLKSVNGTAPPIYKYQTNRLTPKNYEDTDGATQYSVVQGPVYQVGA